MYRNFRKVSILAASALVISAPCPLAGNARAAGKPSVPKSVQVEKGASLKLSVKNVPQKVKVKWSSAKKSVAGVSPAGNTAGKITGKSLGKTVITATVNGKKYKCKVEILPKMSLKKTLALEIGGSATLKVKGAPKKPKVKWSTDDAFVASVSSSGEVTANAVGSANIIAKIGTIKHTCALTVTEKSLGMYDGDIYYASPDGYKTKRNDVTYGEVKTMHYQSTTTGKERRLTVVLPPNYTAEKKYPVMYLLHGLGQDDTDWLGANAPTIIGNMIHEKTAKEMILVLPNCRAREDDSANPPDAFSLSNYQAFDNFINDLRDNVMPFVKQNFSILEGRENTAIGGFSMGGRTALYIGVSMQESFGYIGGGCPAPGILKYTAEAGLFAEKDFTLKPEYTNNTMIMIAAGKSDTVVGDTPESYHNVLAANNCPHIWYKHSGGHDYTVMCNFLYNFAARAFTDNIKPVEAE